MQTTLAALGTTVHVAVRRADDLVAARALTTSVLRDVDEVCSRFRVDSDLSRVNRHAGGWVAVDPLLVAALEVAVDVARQTDGLVHPLLGRPLVELGYDRDFALLAQVADSASRVATPPPARDAWREIALDPEGAVRIPEDTALDLGAVGKAWAADLVAAAFAEHLRGAALVSVGGDLRIAAPDGTPWTVAVSERPGGPVEALVELESGGLATSTTRVRRWTRGGVRRHHLLDPRTGLPASEVWRTVSAAGSTCSAANAASTAAVVLGAEAPAWLDERGVTARLVATDGRVHPIGAWPHERSAA